jgi:hypothetical protein
LKTANALLDELLLHVKPPRGCAIELIERNTNDPNWIAAAGIMDLSGNGRFSSKVADLQKSDPIVDWSAAAERRGDRRRIARWLSEVGSLR